MSGLIRQSGADALHSSRDPRLGIIAAKLKCWAPDYATALFAPPLDIGIPIPEWNPRQIGSRPAGDDEGFDVIVSYEGHEDPDNADGESFELEGSTTEDPIETHWNYDVLYTNYKGSNDPPGPPQWPKKLTDKTTGKQGRNPMHGVTSWPSPSLIWNHNEVSRDLPISLVDQLGTLTNVVPGQPPVLTGDRVWLCIRIRARQRGNIWQLQTSHQLSGPHGYVPEMYARP